MHEVIRVAIARSEPQHVTVRPDVFHELNDVLVSADVLEIDGVLQTRDGCSVRARRARPALVGEVGVPSRDFH
jgi:hypothetical protein